MRIFHSAEAAGGRADVDGGGVESAARSGVGDGGGAAPREGMVGVVGGERLYAGRRRRTMACRRMEFIRRRLGRGWFWLWCGLSGARFELAVGFETYY